MSAVCEIDITHYTSPLAILYKLQFLHLYLRFLKFMGNRWYYSAAHWLFGTRTFKAVTACQSPAVNVYNLSRVFRAKDLLSRQLVRSIN